MSLTFSNNQIEVLRHSVSPQTTLLAGGAVRSGKSYSITMSFMLWLMDQRRKHDYAIVGQSIESIMRNIGFDFIDMAQAAGARVRMDKSVGTRIVVQAQTTCSIWIIGASDAKARRRIQGSTLKGLVVEELPLLPEDFFNLAWSRLSVDGAKMWASYNPEGPAHWAKKLVVDKPERYDGRLVQFLMRDNPSLSEEVVQRYEQSFTGHFYKRLIEGQWAAAHGACYPHWELTNDTDILGGRVSLALDWAVSGTLACLKIISKGKKAIVADELYHIGRDHGLLTEAQLADRIATWIGYTCPVWLDPSTPATFKRLLRNRGFLVKSADNDVIPGIVTTANRLQNGEILINDKCTNLQEELAGYVWDDAAADKGEDKPVKKQDHGCDALRYWAHSTGKAYRHMAPTSVQRALQ